MAAAVRAFYQFQNFSLHHGKDLLPLVRWGVPAAAAAAWMIWPGLTDKYKEEALGIKPKTLKMATPKASPGGKKMTVIGHKYVYEKSDVGELPTLA